MGLEDERPQEQKNEKHNSKSVRLRKKTGEENKNIEKQAKTMKRQPHLLILRRDLWTFLDDGK